MRAVAELGVDDDLVRPQVEAEGAPWEQLCWYPVRAAIRAGRARLSWGELGISSRRVDALGRQGRGVVLSGSVDGDAALFWLDLDLQVVRNFSGYAQHERGACERWPGSPRRQSRLVDLDGSGGEPTPLQGGKKLVEAVNNRGRSQVPGADDSPRTRATLQRLIPIGPEVGPDQRGY